MLRDVVTGRLGLIGVESGGDRVLAGLDFAVCQALPELSLIDAEELGAEVDRLHVRDLGGGVLAGPREFGLAVPQHGGDDVEDFLRVDVQPLERRQHQAELLLTGPVAAASADARSDRRNWI